ncbi:PTS fructose transporter subunit IIC, partial [Lactobacillus taiwanensis]|uniref:PTS fructose transporter subunit IIB n=1 Tax=Lactobacillus taiwanensis TaxID=508451 RepID=UPI000BD36BDD
MTKYQIIAATGCPTGIAHTYMAQEALEQAAKRKGVTIKVWTHGRSGIEHGLSPEEIKEADAVMSAADKDGQTQRFAGKRVIDGSVSKGIKDADKLIEEALSGAGEVMAGRSQDEAPNEEKIAPSKLGKVGHKIYKDLM